MQCKETEKETDAEIEKCNLIEFTGGCVILVLESHANTFNKVYQPLPNDYFKALVEIGILMWNWFKSKR